MPTLNQLVRKGREIVVKNQLRLPWKSLHKSAVFVLVSPQPRPKA